MQKRGKWYCVEISYETQSGEWKKSRSKPTTNYGEVCSLRREYEQTGYKAEIFEVPAPEPKQKPPTRKVGSHE